MKERLTVLVFFVFSITITNAQKITEEDLKRYVITIDSIETLKNQLTATINKIAKGSDKISAQRYSLLAPMSGDAAKLANAKATPGEIEYIKRASETQREATIKFQKAYQALISNYVGDSMFGKIRQALPIDTALKRKHDLLLKKRKN